MVELAKSFINIIDESAYGAGTGAIIPLYVIATESNKVLDSSTGAIAPGTTMANELLVMTSQKDVINTFGVPSFTEVNGTVMQGDELNEVGLLGLYNAMGSSALGYVVRADIDLKQLKASQVAPTTSVNNGTKWLDTSVSNFGVFRSNYTDGASSIAIKQWDYVDVKAVEELDDTNALENDIVFLINGNGGEFREYINNEWLLIGSAEWKEAIGNDAELVYANHINVPSEKPQGSIWIKTTQPNDGSKYVLKTWNSAINKWMISVVPMFGSYIDAENGIGHSLTDGSIAIIYDNEVASIALVKFVNEGSLFITSQNEINLDNTLTGKFNFNTCGLDDGIEIDCTDLLPQEVMRKLNTEIKQAGITGISPSITNSKFNIESTEGHSMMVADAEGTPLEQLDIQIKEVHASWSDFTGVISNSEPANEPEDGTMWFNDEIKVDIMVNNGSTWKGLKEIYPNAELYLTSEEPAEANDMSIWIDTNAENFPAIYRMESGVWNLLDNTDQTSAYGVLFDDARYYANTEYPTFEVDDNGKVTSNLLTSSNLDPDAPEAKAYPKDMILFNTRFSTNNVKQYKKNPFESYTYNKALYPADATTARWISASGNALNGAGLFGSKAQRKLVVDALSGAINSSQELQSINYDFFYATCPGYPEVDDALINLNSDKKDMFYIVSDTPKTLAPTVRAITDWGTNANGADHGLDGRVLRNMYVTRQYPPMGMTSNVDGTSVAVPSSFAKMKNLLNLPTGEICAGTQYGVVSNVSSVGYITDEDEYSVVSVSDGLGEAIVSQSINPIMIRRNTGLLFWGEYTENNGNTSLSDEHAILTLLRLKRELDIACNPFFFRKNTLATRNDFDNVLRTILTSYVANEEIYDFVLDTQTPNTAETISRKELHANIAIEVVKGIEFIYIPIRVVNTGTLAEQSLLA